MRSRTYILVLLIGIVGWVSCKYFQKAPTGLAVGLGATSSDLVASGELPPYNENPVAPSARPAQADPRVPANIHGTFSVEEFMGWMPELAETHESAAGFRKYLSRWYAPNFSYRDTAVGAWAFLDDAKANEDIWESKGIDRGLDAVLVCFHSSHGNMSTEGLYTTWMGTNATNKGWVAKSERMALGGDFDRPGSERLRYMFWDTCYAVRFSHGRNPARTWIPQARGIRMMFGYETPSIDSPNYGQYFWEEWNKGKSLSAAFLDTSWRICRGQTAAVLAFGATQREAETRMDSERFLSPEPAGSNWAAWRWYTEEKKAIEYPAEAMGGPTKVRTYETKTRGNSDAEIQGLAQTVGIMVTSPDTVEPRPFGMRAIRTKGLALTVDPDGDYELALTTKPAQQASAIGEDGDEELIERARRMVAEFDLAGGSEYRFAMIRYTHACAGSQNAPDGNPRTVEKTVVFDQIVEGVPFIDPDAGHIEITFDAVTGQARRFRNSIRQIREDRRHQPFATQAAMPLNQARAAALQTVMSSAIHEAQGDQAADPAYEIRPENEATGYYILDGMATPVYRAYVTSGKFPESRPREVIVPLAQPK